MSELKVNKISPRSGTSFTLGDSGDTFTVPTGASLVATDELKTNKISPSSGTAFTFGDSGDTFTVPSGVTIANSGTATGFGGGKINQLVSSSKFSSGSQTSTSTTYVSTPVTANITPSATSSNILIAFTLTIYKTGGDNDIDVTYFKRYNGGSTTEVIETGSLATSNSE